MLHAGGGYRASGCYATWLEDDLLPDSDDEDDELPPDELLPDESLPDDELFPEPEPSAADEFFDESFEPESPDAFEAAEEPFAAFAADSLAAVRLSVR